MANKFDGEITNPTLRAFRAGDNASTIKYFSELIEQDPNLWHERMYLSMAYVKDLRIDSASRELKQISELCPDRNLREKALILLKEIYRQSQAKPKAPSTH